MTSREDRTGFIAGGTWCADHNKLIERWPEEEELVLILGEEVRGGGPACNLAIGVKRLDPQIPVATIGLLGQDSDGHILQEQAQREGLNCSGLLMLEGHRTTFTDAFTAQDNDRRTHLYYPGTSGILTPDHFDFSDTNARILHLGLPGLHERMDATWKNEPNGWVAVLRKAQSAGIETNLEMCSLPPEQLSRIVAPCLTHLDYLIINEFEVAALAGRPIMPGAETDIDACVANARDVLEAGAMRLIVAHFPSGSVAIGRGATPLITPSVHIPKDAIAGSNGAGDAFACGVLYGMHQSWALDATLQLAHASAAASIRSIGTTDGIEDWRECLSIARHYGLRALPA